MATIKTLIGNVKGKDGVDGNPIGTVISYMGINAPTNYLICDGTEYNIADYPYLTQHFINEFGSVNYFGGDGITTFAIPDLRGEFLRGAGTAKRDTGSGANVGEHQDATKHFNFIGYSSRDNYILQRWGDNKVYSRINEDKLMDTSTHWINYGKLADGTGPATASYHTSRPTNTSVLYCIKYKN